MRVWILALGLTMGLLLAGCGGDDDGDGSGDGALAKDGYISEGDGICQQGTLIIGTAAQSRYGTTQAPPDRAAEFSKEVVVPTLRTNVLDRLRDLEPPEGDEETVAAVYDALEESIDELEANPELLAKRDVGGAFDEPNSLATQYGFTQCGGN